MTTQRAQLLIPASLPRIRDSLLQPLHLPEWNPAFVSITGPAAAATTGVQHPLVARGGLRVPEYTTIGDGDGDGDIGMAWHVPGLAETGTWRLAPRGTATLVTHESSHHGALARVLRSAFAGVAGLRLDRLAARRRTLP